MISLRASGLLFLFLGLTGCGGTTEEMLASVEGQVFYQGSPLAGGTICFTPDPDRGGHGPMAYAEIQPDGKFVLQTGERPGAVRGWHRVTVAPTGLVSLPRRYSDPERSGQAHEVKPGIINSIQIRLD